jgi:hypothetical protein
MPKCKITFAIAVVTYFLINPTDISKLSDWYSISIHQISKFASIPFLKKMGGLHSLLQTVHFHHCWDKSLLQDRNKKSAQAFLSRQLKRVLPNVEIFEEYMIRSEKVDICIPSLKLVIEYPEGRT